MMVIQVIYEFHAYVALEDSYFEVHLEIVEAVHVFTSRISEFHFNNILSSVPLSLSRLSVQDIA
jgi:hypothetical protein